MSTGTEGGESEVAPSAPDGQHSGGPGGYRGKLSFLSHGLFCLKDAVIP